MSSTVINNSTINNSTNNLNIFSNFILIKLRSVFMCFLSKAIPFILLMSALTISNTQSMKQRYRNDDISQNKSISMIESDDFDPRAHGISWIISIIGKEKYKSSGLGYHECFAICNNSDCKLYPEVFALFKKLKIQQRTVNYDDEDAIGRLYEKVSGLVNGTYSREFDIIVDLIQKRHDKVIGITSGKKSVAGKNFDTSGKKTAQSKYQNNESKYLTKDLEMQKPENKQLQDMKRMYNRLLRRRKADNKNADNEFIVTQEDRKSFVKMMEKHHEDQELIDLCGSIFLKAPLINILSNLNFSINGNKDDIKNNKLQSSCIKKSQIFGLMDIFILDPFYDEFLRFLEGIAQNSTNEIFDTFLNYEVSILYQIVDNLDEKKIDNEEEFDDLENMNLDNKRKTYNVLKEYVNRVARYNGIFTYMVANQSSGLSEERYVRFLKQNVNMPIHEIIDNIIYEGDTVHEEFKACAFRLYNANSSSFISTLNAYASMVVKNKYDDYLKKFKSDKAKLEHHQLKLIYITEFGIWLKILESRMRLEQNVTNNIDISLMKYIIEQGNSWKMLPYRLIDITPQFQQGYELINCCLITPLHILFDVIEFVLRVVFVIPATLLSLVLGVCKK